ncbi:EAL domain-containing protein [Kordiimonas sp. SCSIO 12610]|uniref:EAL domain-containing response regulator n=1 Tax=Kordiimonas sp. SCSIO 12610 TaxID=2829597 RepID=UPI00210CF57B|nr:EAL domain-containing response regulator [Kordiimonas sp. SCSIO 12610]UTW54890.1 EAL domain-containing response regulator [Kordiimonas sp. SCSIO 12610]
MSTRILVIDASHTIQDILSQHFRPTNVIAAYVSDRERAFEVLEAERYDYIICDSETSGLKALDLIGVVAMLPYDPGVILIGSALEEDFPQVQSLALAHSINLLAVLERPIDTQAFLGAFHDVASVRSNRVVGSETVLSEAEFMRGLMTDGLAAVFQPKKDIKTGKIVGGECFARWQAPGGGLLGAGAIIKLAREQGHMDLLAYRMIELAFKLKGNWEGALKGAQIWVNVSSENLRNMDFADVVSGLADQYQINAGEVTLEVTESDLDIDRHEPLETLKLLKDRGFKLALDDFGAGYATLLEMDTIPFDEVVIDRKFLSRALKDKSARLILESAIELTHKLDMVCSLEGVETAEHLQLVQDLKADYAQGFLIGKPMPEDKFLKTL